MRSWLRGADSNRRPSGYEPDELPLLHPATAHSRDRPPIGQTGAAVGSGSICPGRGQRLCELAKFKEAAYPAYHFLASGLGSTDGVSLLLAGGKLFQRRAAP